MHITHHDIVIALQFAFTLPLHTIPLTIALMAPVRGPTHPEPPYVP